MMYLKPLNLGFDPGSSVLHLRCLLNTLLLSPAAGQPRNTLMPRVKGFSAMNKTLTEHEAASASDGVCSAVDDNLATSAFQVSTIANTFTRSWRLITCLALAGGIVAYIFASMATRMFTATATIEVNKLTDSPLGASNLNGMPEQYGNSEEMTTSLLTDTAEMQSVTVAVAVIDTTRLLFAPPYSTQIAASAPSMSSLSSNQREQVLQTFSSHLKVSLQKDTKLIEVAFTDPRPDRAALVANEVIKSYIQIYAASRASASENSVNLLNIQLADLRAQVLESERRVSNYEQQTGIIGGLEGPGQASGSAEVSVVTDRLIDLNHSLTRAQVVLNERASLLKMVKSQPPESALSAPHSGANENVEGISLAGAYDADIGLLGTLRQDHSSISLQLATLLDTGGSKNPNILKLQAQLNVIDQEIAAALSRLRRTAQNDYDVAFKNEQGLQQLIAKQEEQAAQITVRGNQLMVLQQEENTQRHLYQNLYAKLQESSVASNMNASNITLVDAARPPIFSTPKKEAAVIEGFGSGALLGIFFAFLSDVPRKRRLAF